MLLVAAIFFIIGTAILAVLEWTTKQKVAKDEITPDNPPFTKSFALIISLIFAGGLFTWLFIIDHANDILVGLSHPLQVLYFEEVVGVNVEQIGYLPTIGAIVALFVTVPLGYWVDKHGENLGMGLAYFLLIFHLGIPLVARNFLGLIPSALVHPFMIGLAAPASLSLISKAIPEEQRGIAFGITWTSRGIISLPSPYLGGLLWDRFSPRTPFLITILGCLGLSIMAFLKLKIPKEESVNVS